MSLGPLHSTRSGVTATFSFLTLSACGAGPVSPQRMTSLKIHTWSQAAYLPGSRTAWASSSGGENTALAWPGAERTKYWDYLLCNRVLFLFEKFKGKNWVYARGFAVSKSKSNLALALSRGLIDLIGWGVCFFYASFGHFDDRNAIPSFNAQSTMYWYQMLYAEWFSTHKLYFLPLSACGAGLDSNAVSLFVWNWLSWQIV